MIDRLVRDDAKGPVAAKAAGRRGLIVAGCWLLLGVLGWLDYITGYEMSFFVFYSVPVGVAAWWLGRWPAMGLALGATLTWLLADYFSGAKYSAPFFYYWNSTIHFIAFMINAVTIAKIKGDLDRRHLLAEELASARETLRALSELLPVCAACGKPREGAGDSGGAELAALVCERPELAGALCAACRTNREQVTEVGVTNVASSSPS